jgi:hypothetical protein
MAGFPSEKAGIEATPLLFRLTFASAFNLLPELSGFSWGKAIPKMKRNNIEIDARILILLKVNYLKIKPINVRNKDIHFRVISL